MTGGTMSSTAQAIHTMRHEAVRHDTLPLRWAGLCPDCETIRDRRTACPYCGSRETVALDRVLAGRLAA